MNLLNMVDDAEMTQRKVEAGKFYKFVLVNDEIPFLVTDDSTLHDIFFGDKNRLINQVKLNYGVTLDDAHFQLPFWQLLDILEKKINDKS